MPRPEPTAFTTATPGPRWWCRLRAQDGSSPVTAVGGVAMFLAFVFLAAQVTLHLYGGSRAGAIALEAATRGARADAVTPCAAAVDWAGRALAGWEHTSVTCAADDATVRVAVRGPSPATALGLFGALTGLDTLDRRATVRREAFR